MNGVIVVDKPSGCTSHDIVQRVRKAIDQRSVGHAGTLDPLATGVLVVAIGEGTKLVSHLQAQDKTYEVTIALGVETDSLDADGTATGHADVPRLDVERVSTVIPQFLGRRPQKAPLVSAIKIGGKPLHRRVRRGEVVEAPTREVDLLEADVQRVTQEELHIRLRCGKGFYVRSFARDLARALGTVGHVKHLRRTSSGRFDLRRAVDGNSITAESVSEHLIPLSAACASLRRVDLRVSGVEHARHGRLLGAGDTMDEAWRSVDADETLAMFDPDGEIVALGRRDGEHLRVTRGFVRVKERADR
jgi:tRNA pseudouridine55 synthase